MVNYDTNTLDRIFSALSHPTRREILARLAQDSATVAELAQPFEMSLPAISKHLRVLESVNLIQRRKQGTTHYLSLNAAPMQEASEWLAYYKQFWEAQFQSLEQFLIAKNDEQGEP